MNDINWEDLRFFRLVAEMGSLSRAAAETGVSSATIARKISRLEKALNAEMFEKTQSGYDLTSFGAQLLERTHSMSLTASDLAVWRDAVLELPLLSIAAPDSFRWFLYKNIRALWNPADNFRLFVEDEVPARKLEHDTSTFLITHEMPKSGNLRVVSLGSYTSRLFCRTDFDVGKDCNWIGQRSTNRGVVSPPRHILDDRAWVTIWASSFEGLVALAENGAGRALLPDFVAKSSSHLEPLKNGPTLNQKVYLVTHWNSADDGRAATLKGRLRSLLDLAQT